MTPGDEVSTFVLPGLPFYCAAEIEFCIKPYLQVQALTTYASFDRQCQPVQSGPMNPSPQWKSKRICDT